MRRFIGYTVAIMMSLVVSLSAALAQEDEQLHLQADEVTHDSDLNLYVARGNVEIQYQGHMVRADTMTYNELTKTISASGNVVILQPSGDTLFSTHADITDTLEEGKLNDFRALLADQSRLAASEVRRKRSGRLNEFDKAVYTACEPCKDHPERAPLWQIKSEHVTQDKDKGTITHRDARIEMFGVPVFYTPWFQHADSGAPRSSGFLFPSVTYSDISGAQIKTPYYAVLAPDKDVTFSPITRIGGDPSNDVRGVGLLEYRQRFANGAVRLAGSGTAEDRYGDFFTTQIHEDDFRGHIEGDGRFSINPEWRTGFSFKNTTDKNYLRRYKLGTDTWLQDRAFVEGFFGRSYATAETLGYQTTLVGLEDTDAPIVAPSLRYNYLREPFRNGSFVGVDLDVLNIVRRDRFDKRTRVPLDGREYLRFSAKPYWSLPFTGSLGDVYNVTFSVEAKGYRVRNVDPTSELSTVRPGREEFNGFVGNVLPKGSFDWRWPLQKSTKHLTYVVQPMVQVVGSPSKGNKRRIPNEDSRSFELDEAYLFERDRFPGLDRLDNGSRGTYGIDWSVYGPVGTEGGIFLGQSYQFDEGDSFRLGSGIEDDLTDIVGRVYGRWGQWFDANYRFRYDPEEDNVFRRHQVILSAGPSFFRVGGSYIRFSEENASDLRDLRRSTDQVGREFVTGSVSSKLNDFWTVSGGLNEDITNNRLLSVNGGFLYQDECFGLGVRYTRSFLENTVDSEDNQTFFFYLSFTNLATVNSNF